MRAEHENEFKRELAPEVTARIDVIFIQQLRKVAVGAADAVAAHPPAGKTPLGLTDRTPARTRLMRSKGLALGTPGAVLILAKRLVEDNEEVIPHATNRPLGRGNHPVAWLHVEPTFGRGDGPYTIPLHDGWVIAR